MSSEVVINNNINKDVRQLLKNGCFGLAISRESISNYPITGIRTGNYGNIENFLHPFVVVNNCIVFQHGSYYDNLDDYNYITKPNPVLKDDVPGSYIITHIFEQHTVLSFDGTLNALINLERYGDTAGVKPIYVSPFIPKAMTKAQIEEALGYKIYIVNE